MRLKKVVISGFRSFKKAESLRVEDRVTVLIGANDHGKSNVLAAIELLNDDKSLETRSTRQVRSGLIPKRGCRNFQLLCDMKT